MVKFISGMCKGLHVLVKSPARGPGQHGAMRPNEGREGVEDKAGGSRVSLYFMSHVKIHVFIKTNYELYVTEMIRVT